MMSAQRHRAVAAVAGLAVAVGSLATASISAAHPGDDGHADTSSYEKIPLVTEGLSDPFEMDVADDGRVRKSVV